MAIGDVLDAEEASKWPRQLQRGKATLADYVDRLIQDPRFASTIAPGLILRGMLTESESLENFGYTLSTTQLAGKRLHYLRKPCRPAEAVPVHPWWSPQETLLVCPDSYRPERTYDPATKSYCGVSLASDPSESDYCGCGPFLLNCYRDRAQVAEMIHSLLTEVTKTIDYLVTQDRPAQTLFSSKETFRDRNAEIWRLRGMWAADQKQQLPDLQKWSWPVEGKWSTREELRAGQQAGILTTPHVMYTFDEEIRPRMKTYFDLLWCKETDSLNVEAQDIFKLGVRDIRSGEGWQQLTKMPICTNCHARLDYAMQYFLGYPSAQRSTAFIPSLQNVGEGSLYGNNIQDLRGHSELNPQAFAHLAVEQPEFASCMVRNIVEHVFNDQATAADYQAVRAEFQRTANIKQMMRTALLQLLARSPSADSAPGIAEPLATPKSGAVSESDPIALPPALHAFLEDRCSDCHSDGDRRFAVAAQLSRQTAQRVLGQVAFGRMPKGRPLAMKDKDEFVHALIPLIWAEPSARDEALRYYGGGPLSVHRLSSVLRSVSTRSRASNYHTTLHTADLIESLIRQDVARYTPGLAATVALEALQVCKQAHAHDADALRRCLTETTRPEEILKDPAAGKK